MKTFFRRIFSGIWKRKLLTLLILLVVAGVGGYIWYTSAKNPKPTYQTAKVQKGNLTSAVTVSGQVVATGNVPVDSQASGVVSKVFVKNGDTVKKGQSILLLTLDQQGQQRQAQALSSYLSAKNSLASAQANQNTLQSSLFVANQKFMGDAVFKNLPTDDPIYIEENAQWLAAEAQYKNQTAVIQQAQVAVSNAWLSYQAASATLTAPVSGRLEDLTYVPGMMLSTQTSSTGVLSQKIATVQTNNATVVQGSVSEIDVTHVNADQPVTVTLDALPGKSFPGKVVAIDKTGSISSGVTTYPVTIQLNEPQPSILPNMSATMSIVTSSKEGVLLVPTAAIQKTNNRTMVRVLKNGQVTPTPVQIGDANDTQTEIVSGLNEGDVVVTGVRTTGTSGTTGQSPFSSSFRIGGGGGNVTRIGGGGGGNGGGAGR